MIWYWLKKFIMFARWLFWPASPRDVARIDPNAPCPICGARKGYLRTIHIPVRQNGADVETVVMCQHTCLIDGARWFENPVVKVDRAMVWPAIARTKIEEQEDEQLITKLVTPRSIPIIGTKKAVTKDVN